MPGPTCTNPTVWCGVCGRGGKNVDSLAQHAWKYHKGTPKSIWFRTEPLPPKTGPARVEVKQAFVDGEGRVPVQTLPPKSDRHNAEKLVDLPWIKFPSTPDECEDALNDLSVAIERSGTSLPFFLSLRAYVEALRKRLKYPDVTISGRCVP